MFLLDNKMSFWQVTVIIIQVIVMTAAADLNSTMCNTKSPSDNANTRTCEQQCLNPVNSSCELSCTPETKDNVINCEQTCLTGAKRTRCKASCDTKKGICDQRLDNGAANCFAKKCTQTCAQPGFKGKCSLECTGYRCFQLCNEDNQCKLSCSAEVEMCHQEIFLSSKPKQAVCNSNHCLQRCDKQTICDCSGSNCRQECYNGGCNMTCHPGVIMCTQYCPHGGCTLTCFAQRCLPIITDNTRSTSSLQTTVVIKTTPFTKRSDWQTTSVMVTDNLTSTVTAKRLHDTGRVSTLTTTSIKTESPSDTSLLQASTGKRPTERSHTPTTAAAERSSEGYELQSTTGKELHETRSFDTPTSAISKTPSEGSVLQLTSGPRKDFNMFLLVVLITLAVVILILVVLIGCLLHYLKKLKSSAKITEVSLLQTRTTDENFQFRVPLMDGTIKSV